MNLKLKIPPLVVTLLFSLVGWFFPNPFGISFSWPLAISSALMIIAGSACALMGVLQFKVSKTTVNPLDPELAGALVTGGMYRLTRNPMYLGFLMWLLGLCIFFGNPLGIFPVVGFVLYMNSFQIVPEELVLEDKFGDDYEDYKMKVRRWL